MFSMAFCAFRSLADDTSFMADVILSVFRTEAIRPFISFNVGIEILRFAQNDEIISWTK